MLRFFLPGHPARTYATFPFRTAFFFAGRSAFSTVPCFFPIMRPQAAISWLDP